MRKLVSKKNSKISKNELKEKQDRFSKLKKFNVATLACILIPWIIIIFLFTALYAIHPTIAIENIKPDSFGQDTLQVNMYTSDLDLDSKNLHRFSFSNGSKVSSNHYDYNKENFDEGENKIEVRREINLLFLSLLSKDSISINAEVDRIPPKLSVQDSTVKYLIQEGLPIKAISETGATLKTDKGEPFGTFKSDEIEDFRIPVVNGENKLKIASYDTFGNKSENDWEYSVNAFVHDGYAKASCLIFNFPYHTGKFQAPGCLANPFSRGALILEAGYTQVCQNCDYIPNNMGLYESEKDLAGTYSETMQSLSNSLFTPAVFYQNVDYVTKQGISGKLIEVDREFISGGNFRMMYFIFDSNGKTYTASFMVNNYNPGNKIESFKHEFMILIDYLVLI